MQVLEIWNYKLRIVTEWECIRAKLLDTLALILLLLFLVFTAAAEDRTSDDMGFWHTASLATLRFPFTRGHNILVPME